VTEIVRPEPLRKSETGYVGKAAKDGSEGRVVSAQRSRCGIDESYQVLKGANSGF
jgi:hypothetical protein